MRTAPFKDNRAVTVAADGTIYVADGHGGDSNARIVKLAPDGTVIKSWGKKGSATGEFNEPHGIALDSQGPTQISSSAPVPHAALVPAVLVAFCETRARFGFSAPPAPTRTIFRGEREESLVPSEQPARSVAEQLAAEQLAVDARTNRRTALVALRGELDLLTVSKVAEVLGGLEPQSDGVRHVVLDLRGLTFMDLTGLHELIRQNEFARSNRHNLAVVRGTDAIQRVLKLTGVEEMLVLVDDPDDLVPPPVTH
jgi:anti-anti-sigma factor